MTEGVGVVGTIPVQVSGLRALPVSVPTMLSGVALMAVQTSNDDVVVADCADSLVAPPPWPLPPLSDSPPESSVNERSEIIGRAGTVNVRVIVRRIRMRPSL